MIDLATVEKHMEVAGADGLHVETIDKICLKMTRSDPADGGVHHIIPVNIIAAVKDGKVTLTLSATEAVQLEKAVPRPRPTGHQPMPTVT